MVSESYLYPENVSLVVISINEVGPYVVASNLDSDYLGISQATLDEYISQLSLTTIVSLGQGHQYMTGCFEFPCAINSDYRLLIIATRIKDYTSHDERLLVGYFHFILFLPTSFTIRLPNFITMEDGLMKTLTRNISHRGDITNATVSNLRDILFYNIMEYVK